MHQIPVPIQLVKMQHGLKARADAIPIFPTTAISVNRSGDTQAIRCGGAGLGHLDKWYLVLFKVAPK